MVRKLLSLLLIFAIAGGAFAQDDPGATDDDVNQVARQLYCPVCENIPLDVCGTAACEQWREEIRTQLNSGMTEAEIIDSFINRFGERVVGTPQDPTLAALSLVTPYLIGAIALVVGIYTTLRWMRAHRHTPAPASPEPTTEDDYRALIERDLTTRR